MRIQTKVLLNQGLTALVVLLVCATIIGALETAARTRAELERSYERLRGINVIAAQANRYSEQIAELFILGADDTADLDGARADLLASLDRKAALLEEHALDDVLVGNGDSRVRLVAIQRAIEDLDRLAVQIAALLQQGRRGEAEAAYRDQVENRLDRTVATLIELALERERIQVEAALEHSARLSGQSMVLAGGLVLVVAGLGLGSAIVLNRTISRPVAALAAAADAVGHGDLTHAVAHEASDELGHLARRFNAMTAQLREQRDRLMRVGATLAEQVEARTRDLSERTAELEAANARLREIDESRARFIADISHELRTPLTVLRGQAEVALRRPDADPQALAWALRRVVAKAETLGRLVDDLLFLARSESGGIEVARTRLVLQDVVADALLDTQGIARREGVRIAPRQPPEPVVVWGDPDRLRQAVLIALDNAIRFAPERSTVAIALDAGRERAVLRVSDQGPGFSEAERERAFERFFQGEGSRNRSGRGLGLGLSIARWIVDRHGGEIRIAGSQGAGAVVEIALPLAQEAEAA